MIAFNNEIPVYFCKTFKIVIFYIGPGRMSDTDIV